MSLTWRRQRGHAYPLLTSAISRPGRTEIGRCRPIATPLIAGSSARRLVDVTSVDTSVELLGGRWQPPSSWPLWEANAPFTPKRVGDSTRGRAANCPPDSVDRHLHVGRGGVRGPRDTTLVPALTRRPGGRSPRPSCGASRRRGPAIVVTVDYPGAQSRKPSSRCPPRFPGLPPNAIQMQQVISAGSRCTPAPISQLSSSGPPQSDLEGPSSDCRNSRHTHSDQRHPHRRGRGGLRPLRKPLVSSSKPRRSLGRYRAARTLSCFLRVVAAVRKLSPGTRGRRFSSGHRRVQSARPGPDAICVGRLTYGAWRLSANGVERALAAHCSRAGKRDASHRHTSSRMSRSRRSAPSNRCCS